jgi:hypothetical protein
MIMCDVRVQTFALVSKDMRMALLTPFFPFTLRAGGRFYAASTFFKVGCDGLYKYEIWLYFGFIAMGNSEVGGENRCGWAGPFELDGKCE